MKRITQDSGFTLIELIVVVGILSVVIVGTIQLFIYTSVSAQLAGNKTLAVSEAQSVIEEIRNHDFDDIKTDYGASGTPGDKFDLVQLNGKGHIYITDVYTDELLELEVVVSWEDKYGRIIGEDTDLDGVLDAGEDTNSDGKLSSIVTISSMITRR